MGEFKGATATEMANLRSSAPASPLLHRFLAQRPPFGPATEAGRFVGIGRAAAHAHHATVFPALASDMDLLVGVFFEPVRLSLARLIIPN